MAERQDHESRPTPDRTEPHRAGRRSVSGRGRPDAEPQPHPSPPSSEEETVGSIIAEAVNAGYEVINENLRQGRIAADRYQAGYYSVDDVSGDTGKLIGRLVELSRKLASTAFDLLELIVNDPKLRDALSRHHDPVLRRDQTASPDEKTSTADLSVGVDLTGRRAMLLSVSALVLPADHRPMALPVKLYPLGFEAPPLLGLPRAPRDTANALDIAIAVPAEQACGDYAGSMEDRQSGATLLTLIVRVTG